MNNWILPNKRSSVDDLKSIRQIQNSKNYLFEDLHPNYVLIDAALWDTDIDILLLDKDAIYRSLFRGSRSEELWSVSPYLVDISSNEELVKKIKEKKQKEPINRRVLWLSSSLNIDELRKHLRRFLRMKTDPQTYIYTRFYDPYVLNCVLSNLTQIQLNELFTSIEYMITEDTRISEQRIFFLSAGKELQIKYEAINNVDDK